MGINANDYSLSADLLFKIVFSSLEEAVLIAVRELGDRSLILDGESKAITTYLLSLRFNLI